MNYRNPNWKKIKYLNQQISRKILIIGRRNAIIELLTKEIKNIESSIELEKSKFGSNLKSEETDMGKLFGKDCVAGNIVFPS